MKKLLFLLVLSFVLFAQCAVAEENITELRITNITTPINAGARLDFSFTAGNMSGPECPANIQYWFGQNGQIQGTDTFYLEKKETIVEDISLILPENLQGIKQFYLKMNCNDLNIIASRIIEITPFVPVMPLLGTVKFEGGGEEGQQMEFAYTVKTNSGQETPVHLQEQITKGSEVVWSNSQNIAALGTMEVSRLTPALPSGNYILTINATAGNETATMAKDFFVSAIPVPPAQISQELLQAIAIAILAILLLGGIAFTTKRLIKGKHGSIQKMLLGGISPGTVGAKALNTNLCPVESESSGTLDEESLHESLNLAKFTVEKIGNALMFASMAPVTQIVRGCISTSKDGEIKCETTVSITIQNSSDRNWTKLEVLAKIPEFFVEDVSEINATCEMEFIKGAPLVKFVLPKIGAMQSTTVSYSVPKIVSQAEANSVPLPAVIYFKESKPLVITKVKVENKVVIVKKKKIKTSVKESGKSKVKIINKYNPKNNISDDST